MKSLAIATHTALIEGKEYDGIGNVIKSALSDTDAKYLFVRHSIDGNLPSEILSYSDSKIISTYSLAVIKKPSPLRYTSEIFSTVLYFSFKQKVNVFIGVDPLNAITGVILKKLGKIERCVFFTADYSPNRFKNRLLNNIYHWIDAFCVKNADEVWNVSTRIQKLRKQMGLNDAKNILVPNVPPTKYDYLKKNKHDKFRLITTGIVDKQLDFIGTLRAVKLLEKEYPKLELAIVGNGPLESEFVQEAEKLGISKRVKLLGNVTLDKSMEEMSKSGIGLSLYTGIWGFNEYGDSTKCREYAFLGLPIVTTDSHSTVDEIVVYKAGIVVKRDENSYAAAIRNILTQYDTYSLGSKQLGQRYSDIHKKKILELLQPTSS